MERRPSRKPRSYDVGQRLLALRTRACLTQTELAGSLGVNRRSIVKWEGGETHPTPSNLRALIELFLARGAFTRGQEQAEAEALWARVSAHAGRHLGAFDSGWFTALTAAPSPTPLTAPVPADDRPAPPHYDWGEAPAAAAFYGRDAELAILHQWCVTDRCPLIALLGMGGIGKTTLATQLARQVAPQFAAVYWRSLTNAPSLDEWLGSAILSLSGQRVRPLPGTAARITQLLQQLRARRCLLIIDNFETLLAPDAPVGTYRVGYEEYGTLLHYLGTSEHQSCLILTSREKPAELGPLVGPCTPVRTLALAGLDEDACLRILDAQGITGSAGERSALARRYGGNPLALKLASEPIHELFGGEAASFLAVGLPFFNGVGHLLAQQLARSTPLEQEILNRLACQREPIPLTQLFSALAGTATRGDALAALESLRRRVLIERQADGAGFSLQPVVLEYITDRQMEQLSIPLHPEAGPEFARENARNPAVCQ